MLKHLLKYARTPAHTPKGQTLRRSPIVTVSQRAPKTMVATGADSIRAAADRRRRARASIDCATSEKQNTRAALRFMSAAIAIMTLAAAAAMTAAAVATANNTPLICEMRARACVRAGEREGERAGERFNCRHLRARARRCLYTAAD